MGTLFSLSVIIILIYLTLKFCCCKQKVSFSEKSEEKNQMNTEYYIDDISAQLDNVNSVMERVQALETLLTDIDTCSPERHQKYFTLEWVDTKGIAKAYTFMIDGENTNTECIYDMAYAERSALRILLKNEINLLGKCSNENIRN